MHSISNRSLSLVVPCWSLTNELSKEIFQSWISRANKRYQMQVWGLIRAQTAGKQAEQLNNKAPPPAEIAGLWVSACIDGSMPSMEKLIASYFHLSSTPLLGSTESPSELPSPLKNTAVLTSKLPPEDGWVKRAQTVTSSEPKRSSAALWLCDTEQVSLICLYLNWVSFSLCTKWT